MAHAHHVLGFAISCVLAFGLSKEECMTQDMAEEDPALSLLQAGARAVHGSRLAAAAGSSAKSSAEDQFKAAEDTDPKGAPPWTDTEETAYVNFIRHGEKCVSSGEYLLPVGYLRADYLGRCMSSDHPSIAMPFGKATKILAGAGEDSLRPMLTALPLAEKLNLTLHMPCSDPLGYHCIADHVPKYLHANGTLIVVDVYQMIPYVVAQLGIADYDFDKWNSWPHSCPSSTKSFKEPACAEKDVNYDEGDNASFPFEPASLCFDQIWQVKYTRKSSGGWDFGGKPASTTEWKAQSITRYAEGFGGTATCPCAQDLAPLP